VTLSGDLLIDLGAITANWRALDARSGPHVETAAVLKADAYGCGAAHVGPALARAGARTFFVALPAEGARLRQAIGPDPVIYVLNGYPAREESSPDPAYVRHALRPVLNSAAQARAWFRDHPEAPCGVHIDTGMSRLGLPAGELAALGPLPGSVRLILSHYACADEPQHPMNARQRAQFTRLTQDLGLPRSLANTGGILLGADSHFDLTRPGIGLYGGLPFAGAKPAVTLHLPILQVRDLAPGETVGYGATWTATRPSRIATLSGGYADGLPRALSGRARAFLDGQPLPFAGRVSMDLIGLDVTDCPHAAPGVMVELLGPHQTVDELAQVAGTIGYELLTSLGRRYTRRYTGA
jgi:alanine racemase